MRTFRKMIPNAAGDGKFGWSFGWSIRKSFENLRTNGWIPQWDRSGTGKADLIGNHQPLVFQELDYLLGLEVADL